MTARPASRPAAQEPSFSRQHARVRVLLSAKLVTTTDETSVTIRDLSLSGAMVQGRLLPRVGNDIILTRGSFEIFAAVIWCRDDMCGVEFDSPLSNLEELLDAGSVQADFIASGHASRHQPLQASATPTVDGTVAAGDWAPPPGQQASLD